MYKEYTQWKKNVKEEKLEEEDKKVEKKNKEKYKEEIYEKEFEGKKKMQYNNKESPKTWTIRGKQNK